MLRKHCGQMTTVCGGRRAQAFSGRPSKQSSQTELSASHALRRQGATLLLCMVHGQTEDLEESGPGKARSPPPHSQLPAPWLQGSLFEAQGPRFKMGIIGPCVLGTVSANCDIHDRACHVIVGVTVIGAQTTPLTWHPIFFFFYDFIFIYF